MKVFRRRPGENWELIEIENTLQALQKEVGGPIETSFLSTDACIICNEEGLLRGLPLNLYLGYPFVGTLLIVGVDGEKFCDVKEEWRDIL